ncbi:MAG: glycosyltransferase [Anaerolineae bacterium]
MRILHLYKDYDPVLGGIENHIKMLAEAQAARGHEVTVLVTSLNRQTHVAQKNGVHVIFASRLVNVSSAPLSLDFLRLLGRERPDVAHLHFPYPPGELANYLVGHASRTVLTYHSDIVRQKYLRVLYRPFMERVLARVDIILATSPNYISSSPVLSRWKSKCAVVPLGIDPAPFISIPAEREKQNGGEKCILFVGRLRYYKGLNDLLRALPAIPNSRLVVVGTGPMEDRWKGLARELGVESRVDFVGEAPDAALPGYYAACDLFCLPCSERSEAFGAVQLEAMASGRPVVSCDVGTGVGWVNQDSVTGLVAPPHDPGALAAAINRLFADPALRTRMGGAGRARVLGAFTLERMVERVLEIYAVPTSRR